MATEEAERQGASRVSALHLKLGPLSGVVKEALQFSYDVACRDTLLEGSQLIIEEVPIVIHCATCQTDAFIESIQSFRCPRCGELSHEIKQGRDLQVVALELEGIEEFAT